MYQIFPLPQKGVKLRIIKDIILNTEKQCMNNNTFLNLSQTASLLKINENATIALVNLGVIPCTKIPTTTGVHLLFNTFDIFKSLENGLMLTNNNTSIEQYRKKIEKKFPNELSELQEFNKKFIAKRVPKGYSLSKVKSKKLGFTYYVRYIYEGRVVPSRWSTHTNDLFAAQKFAVENRERILDVYFKKYGRQTVGLYRLLKNYYAPGSRYIEIDRKRGRMLSEDSRNTYHSNIINTFIPYLRKEKIKNIYEIDTPFLAKYQNYLLLDLKNKKGEVIKKGITAQTINHYLGYVSTIFEHLIITGDIKINPCASLPVLKITDVKVTGCYKTNMLKGAWNKKWKNDLHYMLTLIITTTNMRNCEIEQIRLCDFYKMDNYIMLKIPSSKTKNGIRELPIHEKLYNKIIVYAKKYKKGFNDYIFRKSSKAKKNRASIYKDACAELGKHIGYTEGQLKEENIRFYSSRHFWKTVMGENELGDIEEYFMGHKTSSNMEKNYFHKDRIARKKLIIKIKKLFAILDKHIFGQTRQSGTARKKRTVKKAA